ncbi:acyl-CoA N-acyltransferase [Annulohypoxylon maeteangense]|uniref:acyl-CoA N-acyltransferase n=1 Tax=Annulohypoxylon maeteangense TaxID=1927788 RepID=UPI00200758C8|nr:acyl-CoA N-acyltransferase [Annulohypoxylon maeteangense]KAI0886705.1 acyl-CoA N-acyltransferase [Annulohypoxylon maeteangense]
MESSWTLVATTLPCVPLPPNSQREPIRTKRLVIRPMQEDDLQSYHELRAQPEAMTGTARGRPDRDIDESRSAMSDFLSPKDDKMFLYGVFLASTGELIGEGGVHNLESSSCGWPEIGYKFRKEFWGQGYATEFLGAFLQAWWSLPRSHVKRRVCSSSVSRTKDSESEATEQVYANADVNNIGSRKVLEKLGFIQFSEWTEPDTQEHRIGQPLTLVGYCLSKKKGKDTINRD